MTTPIKATTVLTYYESARACMSLSLSLFGEWELKTGGTNQERPRLSCCLHIQVISTHRDCISLKLSEHMCGSLFSSHLPPDVSFHVHGSLMKHCHDVEMKAEVCQWVQTQSSSVWGLNTWYIARTIISVILTWRNRNSAHYSHYLLQILCWSIWYECNTLLDDTYWTACVYSNSYHVYIAEQSVFVATY
jgi:hypothetical protein